MIPLRDTAPRHRFPLVNVLLILLNIFVLMYQQMLPPQQLYNFIFTYGTVPADLTGSLMSLFKPGFSTGALLEAALPLATANFLHGGWFHLIGNMLYLWIFGDNIEDRFGHLGYLLLYLFMGAAGQLFHILSSPFSTTPLVGASAAIAGVLGAYFVLFPRSRILTLLPLGFFITFVHLPAAVFLGLWFILQIFSASFMGPSMGAQAIAWWAHIGGFIVGAGMGILAKRRETPEYRY